MGQPCRVCTHAERTRIDGLIVEGVPNRRVATQFGLSEASVRRHAERHLPASLVSARQADTVADADTLLARLEELRTRAMGLLDQAEAAGDYRTALAGIREARGCLETLAELQGELDRRPQLVLALSPEWLAVRAAIVMALAPFPDARLHVAAAISQLEAGQ